jgi:hypothetical protein
LLPINDNPILVISDGRIITYRTSLGNHKLPISELDTNGISVSNPKMKFSYDNDEYIFNVTDPKSGDIFLITVQGKDKDGQPTRVLITLKFE